MAGLKLPLALAIALTALAAFKPIVVDEALFERYARQIAQHPGDPYGFEVFWYAAPAPAHEILGVSPGLPYWLAATRSLVGESPVLWKLSLFPFALVFTCALAALARRFAPSLVAPLLVMITLSPGVLPAFNLMLDIPMIALSLLGIALFMRSCESERTSEALLAGGVIGLAILTKLSGFLALAAVALYALLFRRVALAAATGAVATAMFGAWELFVAARYGESNFVRGLAVVEQDFSGGPALLWALSLPALVGALLPAVGLLGLAALGRWRPYGAGALAAVALVFAALPFLPASPIASAGSPYGSLSTPRPEVFLFTPLGAFVLLMLGLVIRELSSEDSTLRDRLRTLAATTNARATDAAAIALRLDLFLVAWFASQIVGYFLISPYPAARRIIELGIVATLLTGRLASRTLGGAPPRARAPVAVAAAVSAGLGLLFTAADRADARTRRDGVRLAQTTLNALEPARRCATTWFAGHWGFQFYAERLGMRPVVPNQSALRRGDCLVYPEGVERQPLQLDERALERIDYLPIASPSPWSTIPFYYVGPSPLRAQPQRQLNIALYRVAHDHVARSPIAAKRGAVR